MALSNTVQLRDGMSNVLSRIASNLSVNVLQVLHLNT